MDLFAVAFSSLVAGMIIGCVATIGVNALLKVAIERFAKNDDQM